MRSEVLSPLRARGLWGSVFVLIKSLSTGRRTPFFRVRCSEPAQRSGGQRTVSVPVGGPGCANLRHFNGQGTTAPLPRLIVGNKRARGRNGRQGFRYEQGFGTPLFPSKIRTFADERLYALSPALVFWGPSTRLPSFLGLLSALGTRVGRTPAPPSANPAPSPCAAHREAAANNAPPTRSRRDARRADPRRVPTVRASRKVPPEGREVHRRLLAAALKVRSSAHYVNTAAASRREGRFATARVRYPVGRAGTEGSPIHSAHPASRRGRAAPAASTSATPRRGRAPLAARRTR